MTTYFFPNCRLDVSDAGETTAYFCPSGRVLERLPRPVEDRATARRLGYGADARRFRREHDLLLHTLATLRGFGCSPALWSLAHPDNVHAVCGEQRDVEEALAEEVHRWLNLDVWPEHLDSFLELGWAQSELRDFLRAILEGEITRVEALHFALAA